MRKNLVLYMFDLVNVFWSTTEDLSNTYLHRVFALFYFVLRKTIVQYDKHPDIQIILQLIKATSLVTLWYLVKVPYEKKLS